MLAYKMWYSFYLIHHLRMGFGTQPPYYEEAHDTWGGQFTLKLKPHPLALLHFQKTASINFSASLRMDSPAPNQDSPSNATWTRGELPKLQILGKINDITVAIVLINNKCCYCFKPLSFRVVCYLAIDSQKIVTYQNNKELSRIMVKTSNKNSMWKS